MKFLVLGLLLAAALAGLWIDIYLQRRRDRHGDPKRIRKD